MEQLNKVELRGMVGNVTLFDFDNSHMARFTLATSYAYKTRNGTPVIETTWHNIRVWEGRAMQDISEIEVGKCMHVWGRIHQNDYAAPDGSMKRYIEIIAQKVVAEEEKAEIQCA